MASTTQASRTSTPPPPPSTRPAVPLTTLFEPPASCREQFTKSGSLVWQGGIMQTVDNGCFPPGFLSIFNTGFSPGVCPQGWTSAASLPKAQEVMATQTNMMCCPKGYFMTRKTIIPSTSNKLDGGFFCASSIASTQTISNVFTTTAIKGGPLPPNQTPQAVVGSAVSEGLIWADIIQVQWELKDGGVLSIMSEQAVLATQTPSPSPTEAPQTQTTGPTGTGAAGATPAPSTGLSGGVIAGVVVGVLAGLILGGVAMWLFFKKRRQRREEMGHGGMGSGGSEKPWGGRQDAELAAPIPSEIDGTSTAGPASVYTASSPQYGHQKLSSPDSYAPSSQGYGQSPHYPAPAYAAKPQPQPPLPDQPPAELAGSADWGKR